MRISQWFLLLFPLCILHAQVPEAASGLHIPTDGIPYALDHFGGNPELVLVHHTTVEINNHKGANVAGSLAGSVFYKPKMTFEVAGEHARTTLHDSQPAFYVHALQDPDGGDEGPVFAIVHATPNKDHRVFAQVRFTQLTGNAKRNDGTVETGVEHLPDGWLRITPLAPLNPGKYALTPLPKAQNAFASVIFDFAINLTALNATDAVKQDADHPIH